MFKKLKLIFTVIFILYNVSVLSQAKDFQKKKYSFSAGMGVNLINTPNLTNLFRATIPYTHDDSIKTFSVGFELNSAFDYKLTNKLRILADYTYLTNNTTYLYSYFKYNYSYTIHKPALGFLYYTENAFYSFDLGPVINYSLIELEESTSQVNSRIYKANGVGINLLLKFRPKLSNNLSAYLTGKAFYEWTGVLKSGELSLVNNNSNEPVNLNNFGVALIIGITYHF